MLIRKAKSEMIGRDKLPLSNLQLPYSHSPETLPCHGLSVSFEFLDSKNSKLKKHLSNLQLPYSHSPETLPCHGLSVSFEFLDSKNSDQNFGVTFGFRTLPSNTIACQISAKSDNN